MSPPLAMWEREAQVVELKKGESGLGFSILDYQVRHMALSLSTNIADRNWLQICMSGYINNGDQAISYICFMTISKHIKMNAKHLAEFCLL